MGRPVKVNGHKGVKVDIYFYSSVGSSVIGDLGSIPSEPEFFSVFFSVIGKIAAHVRGSCLSLTLHRQLQRNYYFYKYTA